MKILRVSANNHKKVLVIDTPKGQFEIPFAKLDVPPTQDDKLVTILVDKELGREAITYTLESGAEESIHLDAFLDYNKDPDYLRMIFLFDLTIEAQKALKKTRITKNAICRRLNTSPSQLARLLDQTNHRKSVDKMLQLLAVLGIHVRPHFDRYFSNSVAN